MERFKLTDQQTGAVFAAISNPSKVVLNTSGMGQGKAQPLSERVLTPSGWVEMGEIRVGDSVSTPDGGSALVSGVFPQGVRDIYRVTFSDGVFVDCDGEHLWNVASSKGRIKGDWRTATTLELLREGLRDTSNNRKFFIPMVKPLELAHEGEMPIDPYTLGVLLGDGSLGHSMVSISTDRDIALSLRLPDGCSLSGELETRSSAEYFGEWRVRGIMKHVRALGLDGNSASKFIPQQYMFSSVESRYALLQGLLDTDGAVAGSAIDYGSVSKELAEGVQFLVQSLGGTARMGVRDVPNYTYSGERRVGQTYYRLYINMPEGLPPFRAPRKRSKWTPSPQRRFGSRSIESIELVRQEDAQCIMVDSSDHLYLTTGVVVTHNTVVTVESVIALGLKRVLIVAPKATAGGWEFTFKRQGSVSPFYRLGSDKVGKDAQERWLAGEEGIFFAGHQMFTRLASHKTAGGNKAWSPFIKRHMDAIIFDEVHAAKNHQGATFKAMYQTRNTADWKFGLSGTWFGNRFEGAYPISKWLLPAVVPDRRQEWIDLWCATEYDHFAMSKKKVTGELHPGAYAEWLSQNLALINLQEDLGVEASAEDVWVEISAKQRKVYNQMQEEYIAYLADEALRMERSAYAIEAPVALRARLRQATLGEPFINMDGEVDFPEGVVSAKLDALEDVLAELGESALILTDSEKFHRRVVERLNGGGEVARMWPRSSRQKRQEETKAAFVAGEFDYLVAVVSRLGAGVDGIQHGTRNIVWLSVSDDGVMNEQVQARVVRRGADANVREIHIRAIDTVDSGQWESLAEQAESRARSLRRK